MVTQEQESARLKDLYSYQLLGTQSDEVLNDAVELASAICDTPVSLMTLLDHDYQYLYSKVGTDIDKIPREIALCNFALDNPSDVLVIDDPVNDPRTSQNPIVVNDPKVRFYAGAPLETPDGNILGTICIIDQKQNQISDKQKRALQLIAKKVMNHLNSRKIMQQQKEDIAKSAERLKRLADSAPAMIFQLERYADNKLSFTFLSKRFNEIFPDSDFSEFREDGNHIFEHIHKDDLHLLLESIEDSYQNAKEWNHVFRVNRAGNVKDMIWLSGQAHIEKRADGSATWFGALQNITHIRAYEEALEQISFDISHVLRKPISTLLGLTTLIDSEKDDHNLVLEYSRHINTVSKELDTFTKRLNETYQLKKDTFTNHNFTKE